MLVANLPYLTGLTDPNPLLLVSGLGTVTSPGLVHGQATIDISNGTVAQALGHRAALDWIHGHLPWWNPFRGLGSPLAGEIDSSAFWPLTLLLLLPNGQMLELVVAEVAAGLLTYLLLRRLACRPWVAAVGGAAYALNGTFAWFAHAPAEVICTLPLLLVGVEHVMGAVTGGRRAGWVLIALGVALSVAAGFPETAGLDGLFALVWVACRAVSLRRGPWPAFLVRCALGAAVGLALAAPVLVAFGDAVSGAYVGPHGSGALAHQALRPSAVGPLSLPYLYGPIGWYSGRDPGGDLVAFWGMVGGYLATSVLVLGLVGLFGRGRRALRVGLGAFVAVALAASFGLPGLGPVLDVIPGVSATAVFRYAPPSWELAAVVLAALGLSDLLAGGPLPSPAARRAGWAALGVAAFLVAAWLGSLPVLTAVTGTDHWAWAGAALVWALLVVAAVALLGRRARGRVRSVGLALVLLVDVGALFALPELSAPRAVAVDSAPLSYLRAHLGQARYFSLSALGPNLGSYYGLASPETAGYPVAGPYHRAVQKDLDTNPPAGQDPGGVGQGRPGGPGPEAEFFDHLSAYRALGVAYLVAPPRVALPGVGTSLVPAFQDRTAAIYRVAGAAPFFSAPGCAVAPASTGAATVTCPGPGRLVRLEEWAPGWSATVDGRPVPVRAVRGGLAQAVTLPAGRHTVAYSFTPPGEWWAGLLFLAGVAACGVGLWVGRRRRGAPAHARSSGLSPAGAGRRPPGSPSGPDPPR